MHFSTDGQPLDPDVQRPTHTVKREMSKKTGKAVRKEFLYPGEHFPYISGVLFSEASNLQQLLGAGSPRFDKSTDTPHIFMRYKNADLPDAFKKYFYYRKFVDG